MIGAGRRSKWLSSKCSRRAFCITDSVAVRWAKEKKVLAQIPGLPQSMPCHYHSMVAETGAKIMRFREFMQFQQTRIYPAYLLAYWRVKDGERV